MARTSVVIPSLGEITYAEQVDLRNQLVLRGLVHPSVRVSDVTGVLELIADPRALASAAPQD
jgi:hypothetical protein